MTSQSTFRLGLLDPTAPAPDGLHDGAKRPAGNRYDVYRNNVTQSLFEAVEAAFPFVRKLIGAQRFATVALEFLRAHPPRSPLMMFYGVDFPEFLKGYAPLAEIGYLTDAARFDLAMRTSYHAANADTLCAETLQMIPEDTLISAQFCPVPATQVIRSDWPLFDIWQYSFGQTADQPEPAAQDILITRPEFDPQPHLLPEGAAIWLQALAAKQSFAQAHETATAQCPRFDLGAALTLALSTAALEIPKSRN